jgi:hypothetical protein
MKYRENFDDVYFAAQLVNDSIPMHECLANILILELGNDAPCFWKLADCLRCGNNLIGHRASVAFGVDSDLVTNTLKLVCRAGRPNYSSHRAILFLTSS